MAVLKSQRGESPVQYLETAYNLEVYTIRQALKLPKRYTFFIATELVRLASGCHSHVKAANSIYPTNAHEAQLRRDELIAANNDLQNLLSLRRCLGAIREKCRALGIVLNEKKTQIIKLTRGISFLKHRFFFTGTGKLILKPHKKTVYRMERKLRAFARWVEGGRMELADVITSLASWRGHMGRSCSRSLVARVERLFYTLFHTKEECICIA